MSEDAGTEHPPPEITVVGPGAVGGLLAAMLCRSGENVTVVARPGSAQDIRASGLSIESSLLGRWTSWPNVETNPLPGALVILAVKAHGLNDAISMLAEGQPAVVVPILNGVGHIDALRQALPGTEIVPATITVEAERIGRATIEHRSPFVRLTVPSSHLQVEVARTLARAGVDVVSGGTEVEVLWRKYRFLAPMALLTALHEAPVGEALARDEALTASVVTEVAAVATAAGLPTGRDELRAILDNLPPQMRSSLQLDMEAGRLHELEAIGDNFLADATAHSQPAPACKEIVELLRERS